MTLDVCIDLAIRGDFCQSLAVVTFQLKTRRSALISPPHSSESSLNVLSRETGFVFSFSLTTEVTLASFGFAHQLTSQSER